MLDRTDPNMRLIQRKDMSGFLRPAQRRRFRTVGTTQLPVSADEIRLLLGDSDPVALVATKGERRAVDQRRSAQATRLDGKL